MDDLKEVLKFYQEIGADFLEKKEKIMDIQRHIFSSMRSIYSEG